VNKNFLGSGWKFPLQLDEENRIAVAQYETCVEQSIWSILGTSPGERVMRPDYGCGIHDLVFAVNSAGTRGRIISEVKHALLMWESRIDVLDVKVSTPPDKPTLLLIEIEYQVRATNSRFNLVYPFHLE
jgi:phage baseplate assembly protein W